MKVNVTLPKENEIKVKVTLPKGGGGWNVSVTLPKGRG